MVAAATVLLGKVDPENMSDMISLPVVRKGIPAKEMPKVAKARSGS